MKTLFIATFYLGLIFGFAGLLVIRGHWIGGLIFGCFGLLGIRISSK